MIILDANIWIAYFNRHDSTHNKASQLWEELIESEVVVGVPEYVLLEATTMISRLAGKKQSDIFLDYVFENEDTVVLPSSEKFLRQVVRQYQARSTKKLSFVDTALLVLSREAEVLTFDKNLRRELRRSEL